MGRHHFFKGSEVDLEIFRPGGYHFQAGPGGFHKAPVFREERGKSDEFIPFFRQGLEADGNGRSSAPYHEQVGPGEMGAEPAVDVLGQGFPDFRFPGGHGVAVDGLGRQFVHDVDDRILDVVRGRHIGIPQAEVADVLRSHFFGPFLAIFKNGPNGGFFRTQFIHFLVYHKITCVSV